MKCPECGKKMNRAVNGKMQEFINHNTEHVDDFPISVEFNVQEKYLCHKCPGPIMAIKWVKKEYIPGEVKAQ